MVPYLLTNVLSSAILAVAFVRAACAVERAHARHAVAAADLHVVTARETSLSFLSHPPPRNVHVHSAEAICVVTRHAFERGNIARVSP